MFLRLLITLIVLFVASPGSCQNPNAIFTVVTKNYSVRNQRWEAVKMGTGWAVAPGKIVTCHHVTSGFKSIHEIYFNGNFYSARLVSTAYFKDLSLLEVLPSITPNTIPLASEVRDQGKIKLWGDYRGDRGKLKSATGTLLNDSSTDANGVPGYSGGPVVNENGCVVGVLNQGITVHGTHLVSKFVPLSTLKSFLDKQKVPYVAL